VTHNIPVVLEEQIPPGTFEFALRHHRNFSKRLPVETQHQLACRSAWSLLFDEEFA